MTRLILGEEKSSFMTRWLKGETPLATLSTPQISFFTDGVPFAKPVKLAGLDYVAQES